MTATAAQIHNSRTHAFIEFKVNGETFAAENRERCTAEESCAWSIEDDTVTAQEAWIEAVEARAEKIAQDAKVAGKGDEVDIWVDGERWGVRVRA